MIGHASAVLSDRCINAWGENELVIRTETDWNTFRSTCFFSIFFLPDVDFSNQMVLVSLQDIDGLGTEIIEPVLEFDSDVVVVIRDDISSTSPPTRGFPFHIVSVSRRDLPVNFIRVKNIVSS